MLLATNKKSKMTIEDFYREICNFSESYQNIDLEEYLLSVFGNVLNQKNKKLTFELALKIFADSFTTKPVQFQEDWLEIENSPDSNRMSQKFTNPENSSAVDKTNNSTIYGIDYTIEVIKFQVAELHKMRGKQLENENRYFGIPSETGNYWYNFDPFGNLECGVRCMIDNGENYEKLDWSFIGDVLENGRIYE